MTRILKHNEALNTWRVVDTPEDGDGFARRLRQSSVLDHTRSFVAWYEETPASVDQWGRPQPGKTTRREIARGEA